MRSAEDLVNEATTLAETIRRLRSDPRAHHTRESRELSALEAQLTGLWAAIRAARAGGPSATDGGTIRRSRPKWR